MTTDLAELKHEVLRDYHRDGMIETMLGYALLSGGLCLISRSAVASGLAPVLIVLMARAWKRRITEPRLGYAELYQTERAARRRTALWMVVTLAVVAGLSAVALALRPGLAGPNDRVARFVFGGIVCAGVAAAGLVQKRPLLCAAAAGLFVLIVIADQLHVSAGYALMLVGALSLVAGLVRLILFLRANPRLEGGPADAPRR
jgi:hypothetical protein